MCFNVLKEMEGDRMEVGNHKQNPNNLVNVHVEVHVKSQRYLTVVYCCYIELQLTTERKNYSYIYYNIYNILLVVTNGCRVLSYCNLQYYSLTVSMKHLFHK